MERWFRKVPGRAARVRGRERSRQAARMRRESIDNRIESPHHPLTLARTAITRPTGKRPTLTTPFAPVNYTPASLHPHSHNLASPRLPVTPYPPPHSAPSASPRDQDPAPSPASALDPRAASTVTPTPARGWRPIHRRRHSLHDRILRRDAAGHVNVGSSCTPGSGGREPDRSIAGNRGMEVVVVR